MNETGKSLLKLLYNEGETICVSNNEFGYHSVPLEVAMGEFIELKSPSEMVPVAKCNTSDLILAAINPINGWRRDSSVTAYRSFLVELDVGSIDEQLKTLDHLKLPFSVQVFSGNKSVHTGIVLATDIENEKKYRFIANWIFNIITLADRACVNPSRSIRIPGAHRDNGKQQKLISMRGRVTQKELGEWLLKYKHLEPKVAAPRIISSENADFSKLSFWAQNMIIKGVTFKNGRNQTWFGLAVDFAIAGFSEEKTIEMLVARFTEEHDFKEKELLRTINSAFKYVSESKF